MNSTLRLLSFKSSILATLLAIIALATMDVHAQ